jgi:hypothetical protein
VSGDPLEGRGEQTDVSGGGNMMIHRDRQTMSTKLTRIAELAKENKELKFLSIAHLLTVEAMERAFSSLRKEASAGEDGITYAQYEVDVGENLEKLHKRLKSGRYRAQPLRRTYVPKEDGGLRPIAIPWLEDKVVQKATVELLSAIYEQDFSAAPTGHVLGVVPMRRWMRSGGLYVNGRCRTWWRQISADTMTPL